MKIRVWDPFEMGQVKILDIRPKDVKNFDCFLSLILISDRYGFCNYLFSINQPSELGLLGDIFESLSLKKRLQIERVGLIKLRRIRYFYTYN